MSKEKYSFIDQALASRKEEFRFRELNALEPTDTHVVQKGGRTLLDFCSNDYLGLSRHPEILERSGEYLKKYGAGSTASRLISGTYSIHERLEKKLADTYDGESALLFNSGFQANSSIISTLTDRHSLILADRLSHNSLLQGSLLSRADFIRYKHNDPDDLRRKLERAAVSSYSRILIATETIFSMDGDRSDIEAIAGLADDYGALLFVDDAHAVGIWGRGGLGLARGIPGVDILLGTCGKAFGSFGSFVICSNKMKDYLINFCPGFIYTTALPPAVIGAIEGAVDLIPTLDEERKRYYERLEHLRKTLNEMGFDTGPSTTQIIPLIIGDEQETMELAGWLEDQGILATAIRPPTVPAESSRIRITLSLTHSESQIDYLLDKLDEWRHG